MSIAIYLKGEVHIDSGTGLRTVSMGIPLSQVSKVWSRKGGLGVCALWTTSVWSCGFLIPWGRGTSEGQRRTETPVVWV